jgi:hypothetical protein
MTDRNKRSNRLSKRFEKDEPDEEDAISSLSNSSKTEKTTKTERGSVKDRPSVLMYLPKDLHTELDIRFDELNAHCKREHGHPIEKNRDYYPAVVEAALENKDIEDVLDI